MVNSLSWTDHKTRQFDKKILDTEVFIFSPVTTLTANDNIWGLKKMLIDVYSYEV